MGKGTFGNERGSLTLEVIAALLVLIAVSTVGLRMGQQGIDLAKGKIAAEHMQHVVEAASRYVRANYSELQAVATPTTAATISISDLKAGGYLPAGYNSQNSWGQDYGVYVLEPSTGDLQVIVLTEGGRGHDGDHPDFASIQVPHAASLLGAQGGFIPTGALPSQPNTRLQGVGGGWEWAFAGTNVPNPGAGHLGAMVYYADGVQDHDYLYRVAVPGKPELNQMATVLNMAGNDIHMGDATVGGGDGKGVKAINFQHHAKAEFACASGEDFAGTVFFVERGPEADADDARKSGGMYVCRDGVLMKIFDEGNLTLPSGGMPVGSIIAWPSATLPRASNGIVPNQAACVSAVSTAQAEAWGCEWLEANGSAFSPVAYPELSAVVGGVLPDYRGVFLRGRGGNAAPLGQLQGDAIRNITGTIGWTKGGGTGAIRSDVGTQPSFDLYGRGWDLAHLDASRVVPTASENRPVNRAVVYLIRAR
ncbi:shufflon system plasmid conjugative transfer pilus tip adhesin PilV (plasmid) [Nitratidesulfovibrio vulgaris]|nr:shufflon system plasmid conjugative transfer pilus tip adhesin PilV [Nitratidesulfovibrio vulgaris]WCB48180.1 shufflon system plasmid conjugative transfer pilus tip adhesin PilV [Nitratidesulfovibrio vulgaris]